MSDTGLVRDVTVLQMHRNGVAGEYFHEVRFTTDNADGTPVNVIAVVTGSECYVITPSAPSMHWRGTDYFGPQLRKWIEDNNCRDCFTIPHASYCRSLGGEE